ncbi:ATP-dependent RNA helicase RhlB [Dokdonella fugitiva]|uniref:ATP-dependent RNA helicase RhlB n=1 Tax=Dokdonella fugitiva TaxID=328517 RepID=A0A839F4K9_9GAMM|nr:ATP-dependent RNA helicase RhlB [Dokdonella fugitiva]MBA8889506.1 ATP-dependent RNA helicase RhlB [Dokdonella fugitiva]
MSQHPITDITFESFDLHPTLLSGLHAAGFTRCTPIQALTLPLALAGRDVAGQAQTGTGKTGAFLVAVLNRLLTKPAVADRKMTDPRAIIIAPTRELAIQIDKDFRNIGRDTGLRSALIYGGIDYDKQREMLKAGCDIIIATPGRLIDYLKQHVFTFNAIEAVVLDEADRMFDLGFIKDIRFLFRRMPPREQRQSMLFSATLSHRVLELAYDHMNEPEKLTVEADNVTADRVRQLVYFPAKEEKQPLLINLLSRIDAHRSIVFINTKIAAEKITRALEKHGFTVATLSGDVPQAKRERLLGRFQKGEIEILVATDVAARGLHIPDVSHVFNYDLPQDAEDYVHRVGRTARLGKEGDAISFACDLYAMSLPDIESYIEQKIPTAPITPDLLVVPPPRPRAANASAALSAEEEAADDARNTAGPPPKSGKPARAPRSRDERGGPREHRGERERSGDRERSRRDRGAAKPAAAPGAAAATTVASNPPPATPAGAAALDGDALRKRRRRGGRGRNKHREGAENATTAAPQSGQRGAPRGERGGQPAQRSGSQPQRIVERKPHPHAAAAAAAAGTPSAAHPPKQGFFRRIMRMFTAR